jgi:hypothetical protein
LARLEHRLERVLVQAQARDLTGEITVEYETTGQDLAEDVPELDRESPQTLRLATLVSIAVRVEPALLRAIRLRLCPHLPVAAEPDLWFSSLTGAYNRSGFTLLARVRAVLQERLAADRGDLERAWQITSKLHARAPQLMRIEEELVWLALSGAVDTMITTRLDEIVAAMTLQSDRGRGLSQWAARALPRLPRRLREFEQVWMLALGGSARLGGRRILTGAPPDSALRTWLPLILPRDTARITVGVRLLPGAVELTEPPGETASVLDVPATDPIVVEILSASTAGQGRQVILQRGSRVVIRVPFSDVYLRTISGEVFELAAGESAMTRHRIQRIVDFRDERLPLLPNVVRLEERWRPEEGFTAGLLRAVTDRSERLGQQAPHATPRRLGRRSGRASRDRAAPP